MNTNKGLFERNRVLVTIIFLALVALYFATNAYVRDSTEKITQTLENTVVTDNVEAELVIVDYPRPNSIVESPLTVRGRARGTWFFEANFPVILNFGLDNEMQSYATAQGEWMTEDFVGFEAVIEFPQPTADKGELILMKANPSGLEENEDSVMIPVRFR